MYVNSGELICSYYLSSERHVCPYSCIRTCYSIIHVDQINLYVCINLLLAAIIILHELIGSLHLLQVCHDYYHSWF